MRNVKLNIRLNGGHYHNNIEELPKSIDSETEMTTNGGLFVGHSMMDWKLPQYVGVNPDNGKAMYVAYYDYDKGEFGETKEASQITDEDIEKSFRSSARRDFFVSSSQKAASTALYVHRISSSSVTPIMRSCACSLKRFVLAKIRLSVFRVTIAPRRISSRTGWLA